MSKIFNDIPNLTHASLGRQPHQKKKCNIYLRTEIFLRVPSQMFRVNNHFIAGIKLSDKNAKFSRKLKCQELLRLKLQIEIQCWNLNSILPSTLNRQLLTWIAF